MESSAAAVYMNMAHRGESDCCLCQSVCAQDKTVATQLPFCGKPLSFNIFHSLFVLEHK